MMIDRLFTLTLVIAVLAGATLAMGSEFFADPLADTPVRTVAELPRVVVTGTSQATLTEVARAAELSDNRNPSDARVQ